MYEHQNYFKVKINPYFKSFSKKRIPNFVSTFYLAVGFGLGLDFGFLKVINEKFRVFFRLLICVISFLLILFLLIQIIYETGPVKFWIDCMFAFQFSTYVLVLATAKYNLYDFLVDIYKIHNRFYDDEYKCLSYLVAYYVVTYALKMLFCVVQCIPLIPACLSNLTGIPRYANCILIFGTDVLAVAQIFIYYYVYVSLKFLEKLIVTDDTDFINARKQFMVIADCCDKIGTLYGKMVSVLTY